MRHGMKKNSRDSNDVIAAMRAKLPKLFFIVFVDLFLIWLPSSSFLIVAVFRFF